MPEALSPPPSQTRSTKLLSSDPAKPAPCPRPCRGPSAARRGAAAGSPVPAAAGKRPGTTAARPGGARPGSRRRRSGENAGALHLPPSDQERQSRPHLAAGTRCRSLLGAGRGESRRRHVQHGARPGRSRAPAGGRAERWGTARRLRRGGRGRGPADPGGGGLGWGAAGGRPPGTGHPCGRGAARTLPAASAPRGARGAPAPALGWVFRAGVAAQNASAGRLWQTQLPHARL